MTEFDDFPEEMPAPGLTRAEIAAEVARHRQRGYQVLRKADGHGLRIVLDDANELHVHLVGDTCQLQAYRHGQIANFTDPQSIAEFRGQLDALARALIGDRWRSSPPAGRLGEQTPASNDALLATLIGGSAVEAVFDPYLTNDALLRLVEVLSFGAGSLGSPLRLLVTSKTTMPGRAGQPARFTVSGVEAIVRQYAVEVETRVMPQSEHRRFLLLSGGRALLLGPSLNAVDKNEAVRLEPDTEDRAFFDRTWLAATPLS